MPASGNSVETSEAILDAATAEFAAKGLAGARVERIAARAGVNKQLLYRYFTDKRGLFDAVLARPRQRRTREPLEEPKSLHDVLKFYLDVPRSEDGLMSLRLAMWESLEGLAPDPARPSGPAAWLVRTIEAQQAEGFLPSELDARLLVLVAMTLGTYPWTFPLATEEVTGRTPQAVGFAEDYEAFLDCLADLLTAGAPPPREHKA
jgi:TetR/AcrR family transcriptional regulator